MTAEELTQQIHSYIDEGLYQEALSALAESLPNEVTLEERQLLKLMRYLLDYKPTLRQACALWWALPANEDIDDDGFVTPKGEVALHLHQSILRHLHILGVNSALDDEERIPNVVIPPTVALVLAREAAQANGVHNP